MANRVPRSSDTLQCLAVRQPWAWALGAGVKTIENRTWSTDYRGPLAILASAAKTSVNKLIKEGADIRADEFPFGAIVAVVDLVDVQPLNESLEDNPWAEGKFCWICENPRMLSRPIPYKGTLHLFDLPANICEDIQEQLAHPATIPAQDRDRIASAITFDPFDTLMFRCEVYGELRDYAGARRSAQKAVILRPKSAPVHYLLGVAEEFLGNLPEAQHHLKECVALDPEFLEAYIHLALVCHDLGDEQQAQTHWQTAKRLNPEVPTLDELLNPAE